MKNAKRYRQRRKILPGFPREEAFQSKDEIDAYFAEEKIQCLLCGKWYRWLTHGHLNKIHNMTIDEYRERYGLPWERGLTGSGVHKTFVEHGKKLASEKPDLEEFMQKIRLKARNAPQRPTQPFQKRIQLEHALAMTGSRTSPWQYTDFEALLARIAEQRRPLKDVCQDDDMPSKRTWNTFTKDHPELRERLLKIYASWPYAVQFKLCKRVSSQFRKDCVRLREQGYTTSEIAKTLGVSRNNVRLTFRGIYHKTPEWPPSDYEAILQRIQDQQRTLNDVLCDPDLPSKSAWQKFSKRHPEFKERVRQIYDSWPYALQARLQIKISAQFLNDCIRLRKQGLTQAQIAETLEVPIQRVRWVLRGGQKV